MIYLLILGILLSVSAPMKSFSDQCLIARQLEDTCGSYCYKTVKPLLDYVVKLQKVERKPEEDLSVLYSNLANLEKIIKDRFLQMERKLKATQADLKETRDFLATFLYLYQRIGSKYYYIEDKVTMSWDNARDRCRQIGGHLASIQNKSEYEALLPKLNINHEYWLDINQRKEGEFISDTTLELAPYYNWAKGEPNNQNRIEYCVCLSKSSSHQMNDAACFIHINFICEYSL